MPFRAAVRRAAIAATTIGSMLGAGLVAPPAADATPTFRISTVASGLSIPWDLTWVGGLLIFDERGGGLWSKRGSAAPRRVSANLPPAYVNSEGGRLGLVADPRAAANKRLYLCTTTRNSAGPVDVRVLRLELLSDTRARLDNRGGDGGVVVAGIPLGSGRHTGCRLRFGTDGMLYVGTGDAAIGTVPQNRQSLGGKVLRVRGDGSIPTDNPFYGEGGNARYVWNYGHRNIQGVALRPGTSELWTVEHGSDRDDEINLVRRGGNYGWDPVPGYDESNPMTDLVKFPSAVRPAWRSGSPTVATSGATFLGSSAWGRWQGGLAVGLLKGQGIRVFFLDPAGAITGSTEIAGLSRFRRIRTVQVGPDKALYFTTSNGGGQDVIGKITPTAKPPVVDAGHNVSRYAVTAARSGPTVAVLARTGTGRVLVRRSTDSGATWPTGWADTGLRSVSAPGAAYSTSGRLDLVTRNSRNQIVHSWFAGNTRKGSTNLGGPWRAATVSSLGDGTLDVWALRVTGGVYRRHFDGSAWSSWRKLASGGFSSAVGASADPASGRTRLTVRGPTGRIYERVVTATSNGSGWSRVSGLLWSGRAFGDQVPGEPLVSASKSSDGRLRLQRDALVLVLGTPITGDPDVVTRPDGSWLIFARAGNGDVLAYDSRTRSSRNLGGDVG